MISLRMHPHMTVGEALTQIKLLSRAHPGTHRIQLHVGGRILLLGGEWRYEASPLCLAALGEFGEVLEPEC